MTIGEVLRLARTAPALSRACFDFCGCYPTSVDSWRGVYSEAALGWSHHEMEPGREDKAPTAAAFVKMLEDSISGREFTGWKGGEFTYNEHTPLHVDNAGDYTRTEIVGVRVTDYAVILCTIQSHD